MDSQHKAGGGKTILLCFVAFFGLITIVNSIFIYMAIRTNAGVVTDSAYEKGLAYNKILAAARAQPSLQEKTTYIDGILRWELADESGKPLKSGKATALLVRPVKGGYDFLLTLKETAPGVYEARPDFPMQGLWTARLDMQWNDKQYQTTQDLMVK